MNRPDQIAFGQKGCNLTAATSGGQVAAPSGKTIVAITVLSDSQTITSTSEDTNVWPSLSTSVPKGVTVFGRWTDISSTNANGAIYYFG